MTSSEVFIDSPVREAYSSVEHSVKRSFTERTNIGVTACTEDNNSLTGILSDAKELGFDEFSLDILYEAIILGLRKSGKAFRTGNKYKKERGEIVSQILAGIQIERDQNTFRTFFVNEDDTDQNGTGEAQLDVNSEDLKKLRSDHAIYGRVLGFAKKYIKENTGIVVLQDAPKQLVEKGLGLVVCDANRNAKLDIRRKASKIIIGGNRASVRFGLLREIVYSEAIAEQQQALKRSIENGTINLEPKFGLANWPRDPFMTYIRECVAYQANDFLEANSMVCDPQDLKYQVLFRLTTFPVESLFYKGKELDDYLRSNGNYNDWRNISNTDPSIVRRYRLNKDIVDEVIFEQAAIIQARLEKSPLPLKNILTPSGIFSEPGWVIQRKNGTVQAVKEEGITSVSDSVNLRFEKIDSDLAAQIHSDLHYIHTPRADIAFGLFVDGEDFPFSALAFEKIDRDYKTNTLLLNGYDPRKCYDLTRLYSRPGTPGNTSSSMFSLAFGYLKSKHPEIQAIMSSFMPSYATGVSMTSGGFDNPVLIKPLRHVFLPKEVGGAVVFEHLTKRRMDNNAINVQESQFPLLPTVELMSSLQEPAFPPVKEMDKFMVEI